jgi:hypothetical protein
VSAVAIALTIPLLQAHRSSYSLALGLATALPRQQTEEAANHSPPPNNTGRMQRRRLLLLLAAVVAVASAQSSQCHPMACPHPCGRIVFSPSLNTPCSRHTPFSPPSLLPLPFSPFPRHAVLSLICCT